MAGKAKRKATSRRSRGGKSNVSVKTAVSKVAKTLGLPVKAVHIVRPNRKKVHPRERLANVRAWWDSD